MSLFRSLSSFNVSHFVRDLPYRYFLFVGFFVFFNQKTPYDVRISDWSSDVCSSDLPRIGQRAQGDSTEARLSRTEQPTAAEETAARIAEGNAAYEARFGRIFLVRAAGRTAEEILANLTERLTNAPATE